MCDDSACDSDAPATVTLHHVAYQGDMFSKMLSRKEVCEQRYEDMKQSDNWDV